MQTTATYEPASQEFVIHTPTTLAQVRSSRHALEGAGGCVCLCVCLERGGGSEFRPAAAARAGTALPTPTPNHALTPPPPPPHTAHAQKYWITNASVHAQWAVVFAQLWVGGANQGIHGFLVR